MNNLAMVISIVMCNSFSDAPCKDSSKVEIWLSGKVEKIKGKIWPKLKNGQLLSSCAIEEPRDVVVHLADGRIFKSYSKIVWLGQKNGMVREVSLLPLEKPLSFHEATLALKSLGKGLKVEKETKFTNFLKELRKAKKGKDATLQLDIGKDMRVRFDLRFYPNARGWFIILDLTVPRLYGLSQ